MLRKVVEDLVPRCLGADELVVHRFERRLVDQRSIRNTEVPVAGSPIEE